MNTTQHPYAQAAEDVLTTAAQLVHDKWQRRDEGHKPYGIPEALAEAGEGVPLVIAERQCVTYGLDVWWNDLLCLDGDDAAEELLKLTGIQPDELYGHMWEANLGLLALATSVSAAHLNGLSNVYTAQQAEAYTDCLIMADTLGRAKLLSNLCEDIHFSVAHVEGTPAAVNRRLKGIRALECVAAHHVLYDVLPLSMKQILCGPVAKMLLPIELNL